MSDQLLYQIQTLQFSDQAAANALLKDFVNDNFPFNVEQVQVRPSAVSLNSINGFLHTVEGDKLFFKTHVEPQSLIHEYYNSTIMAEAGYPIIQPIFSSTEWGKQLLVYEFFESPSLFDVARQIETGQRGGADQIIALQEKADQDLWAIYQQTLQPLSAEDHAEVPIHQLFVHRLVGGRYHEFYAGKEVKLPGHTLNFDQLAQLTWQINGIPYQDTLADIIQTASQKLVPTSTPSVVGHGDAHNGNVFVDEDAETLIYFDPAFAGRHSPFLDLTKPIFHNVFAIWLYFPQEIAKDLSINLEISADQIQVDHDFRPSAIRLRFLQSKLMHVLRPLLERLKASGQLPETWRQELKLALFCCPFLTMNLCDIQRFPPEITLLGLSLAVEMGSSSTSQDQSILDTALDQLNI